MPTDGQLRAMFAETRAALDIHGIEWADVMTAIRAGLVPKLREREIATMSDLSRATGDPVPLIVSRVVRKWLIDERRRLEDGAGGTTRTMQPRE